MNRDNSAHHLCLVLYGRCRIRIHPKRHTIVGQNCKHQNRKQALKVFCLQHHTCIKLMLAVDDEIFCCDATHYEQRSSTAMLLTTATFSPWTFISLVCLLVCALCVPKTEAGRSDISKQAVQRQLTGQEDVSSQLLYSCPYPDALNETQHKKFLNTLNGKRVTFIGDSITRCCALVEWCIMTHDS